VMRWTVSGRLWCGLMHVLWFIRATVVLALLRRGVFQTGWCDMCDTREFVRQSEV
jgi:hypothetical protein